MKEKSEVKSNTGDSGIRLTLVPEEVLSSIIIKQDKILDLHNPGSSQPVSTVS